MKTNCKSDKEMKNHLEMREGGKIISEMEKELKAIRSEKERRKDSETRKGGKMIKKKQNGRGRNKKAEKRKK